VRVSGWLRGWALHAAMRQAQEREPTVLQVLKPTARGKRNRRGDAQLGPAPCALDSPAKPPTPSPLLPSHQNKLARKALEGKGAVKRSRGAAGKPSGILSDVPVAYREWIVRHSTELGCVPEELAPQALRHGEHSYTVWSPSGNGARVEVLLTRRQYYVKAAGPSGKAPPSRTVRWDKDGSARATWTALSAAIDW
jgi:hypothetical protein